MTARTFCGKRPILVLLLLLTLGHKPGWGGGGGGGGWGRSICEIDSTQCTAALRALQYSMRMGTPSGSADGDASVAPEPLPS